MLLIETLAAASLCLQSWPARELFGASACGRGYGDLSYLAKSTTVTGGYFIIVTVTVRYLRPGQLFQFSPGLAAICPSSRIAVAFQSGPNFICISRWRLGGRGGSRSPRRDQASNTARAGGGASGLFEEVTRWLESHRGSTWRRGQEARLGGGGAPRPESKGENQPAGWRGGGRCFSRGFSSSVSSPAVMLCGNAQRSSVAA